MHATSDSNARLANQSSTREVAIERLLDVSLRGETSPAVREITQLTYRPVGEFFPQNQGFPDGAPRSPAA